MKALFLLPDKGDLLIEEEMVEMTNSQRRDGQIKWLDKNSYVYEVYADGWPRVHRYYRMCRLLGIDPRDFMLAIQEWKPDFSRLND